MVYRRRLKEKKKNIAVPLFIIAIMVLSALGYALFQARGGNVKRFNSFKFIKIGDRWKTKIDNIEMMFYFAPDEVEDIPYDSISTFPYFVYLTSNPEASYSQQDLMTIEVAKFELKNILYSLGYTPSMNFSKTITCENSTSAMGVIDLDISNETAINIEDSCVKITGINGPEIVRARDKFLMLLLGILK